jgi:hypothetical protein
MMSSGRNRVCGLRDLDLSDKTKKFTERQVARARPACVLNQRPAADQVGEHSHGVSDIFR